MNNGASQHLQAKLSNIGRDMIGDNKLVDMTAQLQSRKVDTGNEETNSACLDLTIAKPNMIIIADQQRIF